MEAQDSGGGQPGRMFETLARAAINFVKKLLNIVACLIFALLLLFSRSALRRFRPFYPSLSSLPSRPSHASSPSRPSRPFLALHRTSFSPTRPSRPVCPSRHPCCPCVLLEFRTL
jgi:hypothetical protein